MFGENSTYDYSASSVLTAPFLILGAFSIGSALWEFITKEKRSAMPEKPEVIGAYAPTQEEAREKVEDHVQQREGNWEVFSKGLGKGVAEAALGAIGFADDLHLFHESGKYHVHAHHKTIQPIDNKNSNKAIQKTAVIGGGALAASEIPGVKKLTKGSARFAGRRVKRRVNKSTKVKKVTAFSRKIKRGSGVAVKLFRKRLRV